MMIQLLAAYLFIQKHIISGLTGGSNKGYRI